MAFADKSLDELYKELRRVEQERDAKGPKHPDYPLANIMISSLKSAISEKKREK